MKITTVVENSTVIHNLMCSHGQFLLIEDGEKKVLFDVGEIYENLMYNLKQMNIRISDINSVGNSIIIDKAITSVFA